MDCISIHALREEGDLLHLSPGIRRKNFYPRPPRGGRPARGCRRLVDSGFLSTPSARRATVDLAAAIDRIHISIHALREEGDVALDVHGTGILKFLSTPSARRATHTEPLRNPCRTYFYPRPPRGGRRCLQAGDWSLAGISIHALREEGDF